MNNVRAHIKIKGLVQGVCFRYETKRKARQFGVTGWIKNSHDGSVEATFEGEKDSVNNIIKWCHQGPTGAFVKNVDIEYKEYSNKFNDFNIVF